MNPSLQLHNNILRSAHNLNQQISHFQRQQTHHHHQQPLSSSSFLSSSSSSSDDDDSDIEFFRPVPSSSSQTRIGSYHDGYVHGREDFGDFQLRKQKERREQQQQQQQHSPQPKMKVHVIPRSSHLQNSMMEKKKKIMSPESSSSSSSEEEDFFRQAVVAPIIITPPNIQDVSTTTKTTVATNTESGMKDQHHLHQKQLEKQNSEYKDEVERLKRELSFSPSPARIRQQQQQQNEQGDEKNNKEQIQQLQTIIDSLRKTEAAAGERILMLEESLDQLMKEQLNEVHQQQQRKHDDNDDEQKKQHNNNDKSLLEESQARVRSLEDEISYIRKIQKEKEEDEDKIRKILDDQNNNSCTTTTKRDIAVGRDVDDDDDNENDTNKYHLLLQQQQQQEQERLHHQREMEMLHERISYLEDVLRSKQFQDVTDTMTDIVASTFKEHTAAVEEQFESARREIYEQKDIEDETQETIKRKLRDEEILKLQQLHQTELDELVERSNLEQQHNDEHHLLHLQHRLRITTDDHNMLLQKEQQKEHDASQLEAAAAERIAYLEGLLNDVQRENEHLSRLLSHERETAQEKIRSETDPLKEEIEQLKEENSSLVNKHSQHLSLQQQHHQQLLEFMEHERSTRSNDVVAAEHQDLVNSVLYSSFFQSTCDIFNNQLVRQKQQHEGEITTLQQQHQSRVAEEQQDGLLCRHLFVDELLSGQESTKRRLITEQESNELVSHLLLPFFFQTILPQQQRDDDTNSKEIQLRQQQHERDVLERQQQEFDEEREEFANIIKRHQDLLHQLQERHSEEKKQIERELNHQKQDEVMFVQNQNQIVLEEEVTRSAIIEEYHHCMNSEVSNKMIRLCHHVQNKQHQKLIRTEHDKNIYQSLFTTNSMIIHRECTARWKLMLEEEEARRSTTNALLTTTTSFYQSRLVPNLMNELQSLRVQQTRSNTKFHQLSQKQQSTISRQSSELSTYRHLFAVECLVRVETQKRNDLLQQHQHDSFFLFQSLHQSLQQHHHSCYSSLLEQYTLLDDELKNEKDRQQQERDHLQRSLQDGSMSSIVDRSSVNVDVRYSMLFDSLLHSETTNRISGIETQEQIERLGLIGEYNKEKKEYCRSLNNNDTSIDDSTEREGIITATSSSSSSSWTLMLLIEENEESEKRYQLLSEYSSELLDLIQKQQLKQQQLQLQKQEQDLVVNTTIRQLNKKNHALLTTLNRKKQDCEVLRHQLVQDSLLHHRERTQRDSIIREQLEESMKLSSLVAHERSQEQQNIAVKQASRALKTNLTKRYEQQLSSCLRHQSAITRCLHQELDARRCIEMEEADAFTSGIVVLSSGSMMSTVMLQIAGVVDEVVLVERQRQRQAAEVQMEIEMEKQRVSAAAAEEENQRLKKVIDDLESAHEQERETLKKKCQHEESVLLQEKDESICALREENEELKIRIQELHHHQQQASSTTTQENSSTVNLDRQQEQQRLNNTINQLQEEKKTLIEEYENKIQRLKQEYDTAVVENETRNRAMMQQQQQQQQQEQQLNMKKTMNENNNNERIKELQSIIQGLESKLQNQQQQLEIEEHKNKITLQSKDFELRNLRQDYDMMSKRLKSMEEQEQERQEFQQQQRLQRQAQEESLSNEVKGKSSQLLDALRARQAEYDRMEKQHHEDKKTIEELRQMIDRLREQVQKLMQMRIEEGATEESTSDDNNTINDDDDNDDDQQQKDDDTTSSSTTTTTTTDVVVRLPHRPVLSQPGIEVSNDQRNWFEEMRDSKTD